MGLDGENEQPNRGASVVSLVQQLKSGNINKEQLFAQLSKLQNSKREEEAAPSAPERVIERPVPPREDSPNLSPPHAPSSAWSVNESPPSPTTSHSFSPPYASASEVSESDQFNSRFTGSEQSFGLDNSSIASDTPREVARPDYHAMASNYRAPNGGQSSGYAGQGQSRGKQGSSLQAGAKRVPVADGSRSARRSPSPSPSPSTSTASRHPVSSAATTSHAAKPSATATASNPASTNLAHTAPELIPSPSSPHRPPRAAANATLATYPPAHATATTDDDDDDRQVDPSGPGPASARPQPTATQQASSNGWVSASAKKPATSTAAAASAMMSSLFADGTLGSSGGGGGGGEKRVVPSAPAAAAATAAKAQPKNGGGGGGGGGGELGHDVEGKPNSEEAIPISQLAQVLMNGSLDFTLNGSTAEPVSARENRRPASASRARPSSSSDSRRPMTPVRMSSPSMIRPSSPVRHTKTLQQQQREEAIQQERNQECTFKPKIRELPKHYNSNRSTQGSFVDRVTAWQNKKMDNTVKKKTRIMEHETQECTFAPKVNHLRVAPRPESPVADRLYQHGKERQAQLEIVKRIREEEALKTQCPFQPNINKEHRSASPVKPRYREPKKTAPTSESLQLQKELQECTFAPKTNRVPLHMNAAQSYLEESAFDRLSRVRSGGGDSSVVDVSFGSESSEDHSPSSRRQSDQNSELNTSRTRVNFNEFLDRQAQREERKQEKLSKLAQEVIESTHKPTVGITPRSRRLAEKRTGNMEFLERVQSEVQRRGNESSQLVEPDQECTFVPNILPSSRNMRRRTVEEMSEGDRLKQQAIHDAVRMQNENDHSRDLTFRPKINQYAHVESKLRIVSDPDSYLSRLEQEARQQHQQQVQEMLRRRQNEMEECTFTPQIHDAPEFVKRIANNVRRIREVQEPTPSVQSEPVPWRNA